VVSKDDDLPLVPPRGTACRVGVSRVHGLKLVGGVA
jgi:hypothetical protein